MDSPPGRPLIDVLGVDRGLAGTKYGCGEGQCRAGAVLLDRPDTESVGAGETPIIAVAPAMANAFHHATGQRARELPAAEQSS